ncbi:DUF2637 domain-containing protein [Kitasatospora sp. NBC_00240]|uniref:DUF2637 domain-containing protein n=1 Tax=Kitasatospora sp. NBC_00240 TaxID=2903567 RepID=UPI00225AF10B|nr:DUF2637 domain-containing protein [Kitasatospora sp. NBC_00240]MCX5211462.1 DUF2637 domain-containing protein [Kitasatospora sp. NBC_00240]
MRDHSSRLTAAAAAVIGLLTGSAFWLSYAHLHTVAAEHGLGGSPARAWAWPGCLDLFIVAGELLMLRASLSRRTDWWAIGLTVVGSGGSIALNIAGVQGSDPLDYVVAAVPPTAALLAFGALMRQVHDALSNGAGQTALSIAETPASRDLVHIVNEVAHTPSDLQFSRIRENAQGADQAFCAVPQEAPADSAIAETGINRGGTATVVRDSQSLTEGQSVPLSVERVKLTPSEVPAGPLSVGSPGDLANGEGTHPASTPDHVGGAARKGVQTVHTPEVPSAAVTEFVTERASTATDTPGGNRGGTATDGVGPADASALDAVEATPDAPHPAASDAASGHPWAADQRLPEVPSAGRTVPVLGPIPWPGLDGASVHPALHPAASAAGQDDLDHFAGSRKVITGDVSAADPTPGPDAPDAPDALPDADAPEAALIATARAVDRAARAETGRAASLRRLQAELRIGQPRAQQLQRILANA